MRFVSLVESPPSLHVRGNAFQLTGRLMVIRLTQTLLLPVVLPPQSVRYRLGMPVMGVGTEGQVWTGGAEPRQEIRQAKERRHQEDFLLYQEWLAISPQHLNHKHVMNAHLEQSTPSYPLTNPGDDSLYS